MLVDALRTFGFESFFKHLLLSSYMNIAIVYDNISSYICGANISTQRFANLLKKRGHKVIFISSHFRGSKKVDYYAGIKTYRFFSLVVPETEGNFFVSFPSTQQIKEVLIKEQIDIVHFMTPMPSAKSAIRAARDLGLKVVAHSHTQPENIFLYFPKIFRSKLVYDWFYRKMTGLYKQADLIACPSKFAEKKLKEYDEDLNTFVLSNGVDRHKYRKINFTKLLAKHGLSRKSKKILFIGRFYPEKNVGVLIKAMPYVLEKNKDVDLMLVGDGDLKDNLKQIARDIGVEKNIHFFGRISEEDIIQAYNTCDIFVLPSIAELEGMVVLEAMACGKPIIISDSKETAAKDFVDGNGFIFKTFSPKDLSDKINSLLSNSKLLKKMGKRSYINSKDYDITRSVRKLEKEYRSLLKK